MSSIHTISNFRVPATFGATYDRLLEGVRNRALGTAVREAVRTHTSGTRRLYLYEAAGREESCLRYHDCEPAVAALFPRYDSYFRRFDPISEAYRAAPRTGDIVMQRVRPSEIGSADFRRRFFDDAGIIERVSIIQRGASAWRAINLARHRSDGYFTDAELDNIIGLAGLALPLLMLDRDFLRQEPPCDVRELEARFAALFPELPRREREVCARAARGMSVEATALDLAIGAATVLTYRRRAYCRLQVSSPIELCSLVAH
jgi:DNA-binding CsgD family transcriptional regulator